MPGPGPLSSVLSGLGEVFLVGVCELTVVTQAQRSPRGDTGDWANVRYVDGE